MKARFKIEDYNGNVRYLTIKDGRVRMVNKIDVPMNLSYISPNPVEMRWALEEAKSPTAALHILKKMGWKNDKVVLLSKEI